MIKGEWGAESNGKLPYLYIPDKTAALFTDYAVEDLPFGRTAALVSEFAVDDLPLGRTAALVSEFAVDDLPLGRTATWFLSLQW